MFKLSPDRGMETVTGRPLDQEIERVERLLAVLKAAWAGMKPHEFPDIEDAPVIDNWTYGKIAVPCLYGIGIGHPRLGTRPIRTSDIWIDAPEYGAVRTLSRWYRLARPLETSGDGAEINETRLS